MGRRDRMGIGELLDDTFIGEPITITTRSGVAVTGHVHSRHRAGKDNGGLPQVTINEGGGAVSSILDDNIERIVLEDAEWRRSGT